LTPFCDRDPVALIKAKSPRLRVAANIFTVSSDSPPRSMPAILIVFPTLKMDKEQTKT
jgi:hypothetical protein